LGAWPATLKKTCCNQYPVFPGYFRCQNRGKRIKENGIELLIKGSLVLNGFSTLNNVVSSKYPFVETPVFVGGITIRLIIFVLISRF